MDVEVKKKKHIQNCIVFKQYEKINLNKCNSLWGYIGISLSSKPYSFPQNLTDLETVNLQLDTIPYDSSKV